jgi:hypothetical protein
MACVGTLQRFIDNLSLLAGFALARGTQLSGRSSRVIIAFIEWNSRPMDIEYLLFYISLDIFVKHIML